MTDWRKFDAGLAAALGSSPGGPLTVFVHVDPEAAKQLKPFGVRPGSVEGGIATATLRRDQIEELSDQAFVRRIRLSSPLRLLDDQ